jgi:hypothetical protein
LFIYFISGHIAVFIDTSGLNILKNQHMKEVEMFAPKSYLTAQNSTMPFTTYDKVAASRLRTRMTQIAQIFTDPCASASSAQSAFHRIPSAFICVYLRLIFVSLSDRTRNIQFKLFPIFSDNGFVPCCQSTTALIFASFALRILHHPKKSTHTNLEENSFFTTQSKRSTQTT